MIAVKSYLKTPLSQKSCAVVYRKHGEMDGFIVTADLTSHPALWKRIIWKKVFERKDAPVDWEYDDEADTLYL